MRPLADVVGESRTDQPPYLVPVWHGTLGVPPASRAVARHYTLASITLPSRLRHALSERESQLAARLAPSR